MLRDKFERTIDYLRISVTKNCNLKCFYCTSKNSRNNFQENHLTNEEIFRISKIAASLGIKKVRLTGGEPLLRKDIVALVKDLSSIEKIKDLSLTTNGTLLEKYAIPLKDAGLRRINISLDTLNENKFEKITMGKSFKGVLKGIEAVREAGFNPIKINVVVIRGLNDDELESLIEFGREKNLIIRFIEYMPISTGRNFSYYFISRDEILKRISHLLDNTDSIISHSEEPSIYIPLKNGKKIGIISSVSHGFCEHCNRLRITSEGFLRSCLTQDVEINILQAMRNGGKDSDIEELFRKAVMLKPEKGCFGKTLEREMREIGG
ncbi:MAG: GTP 3',8-cyclase MoaA [Candidatus Aminicenantia bacterium]